MLFYKIFYLFTYYYYYYYIYKRELLIEPYNYTLTKKHKLVLKIDFLIIKTREGGGRTVWNCNIILKSKKLIFHLVVRDNTGTITLRNIVWGTLLAYMYTNIYFLAHSQFIRCDISMFYVSFIWLNIETKISTKFCNFSLKMLK